MKKLQLKQIIREELAKALNEAMSPELISIEAALDNFYDSYLAKDLRLSRKITNEERIKRLQAFIGILESHIDKCEMGIDEENSWIGSRGKNVNESDEKIKTYDELVATYNPENGPAYLDGLEDEPGFKLLPLEKRRYLVKWLEHQKRMDR